MSEEIFDDDEFLDDYVPSNCREAPRYYVTRTPAANPAITDPIWPGDPFWRSKKYSRALRAKVAHEWHHDPSMPSLHSLSKKYNVSISSLTAWCHAYPFGSRSMLRRNYTRHHQTNPFIDRERAKEKLAEYTKELRNHSLTADPTWWITGDPLPSRCAKNLRENTKRQSKITLPPIAIR